MWNRNKEKPKSRLRQNFAQLSLALLCTGIAFGAGSTYNAYTNQAPLIVENRKADIPPNPLPPTVAEPTNNFWTERKSSTSNGFPDSVKVRGENIIAGKVPPDPNCPLPKHDFHSYSHEEWGVYNLYYSNPPKCGGVVVEIGGFDGTTASNSWFFEKHLNWKSILVEANPEQFAKLKKNRPNAYSINAAVCPEGQTVELSVPKNNNAPVGGLRSQMEDSFYNSWFKDGAKTFQVECTSWKKIFADAGVTHVDVFSLDVEGSESMVLEEMDWSVTVDVWIIEIVYTRDPEGKKRNERVASLLKQHGYVKSKYDIRHFCGEICMLNEMWVRKGFEDNTCYLGV